MNHTRVITPAMLVAMGAVARGAAWLDAHLPGWHRAINLLQLNIRTCDDCVLAQASAMPFNPACEMFGLSWYRACSLGFDIQAATTVGYDDLQACWIEEIRLRRQIDTEMEDAALASLHNDDTVGHVPGEWGEIIPEQEVVADTPQHGPPLSLAIA